MKIHILLLSLLGTTAGIMYAAQVAGPATQPGFFQQHTDAVRQEIAEMIPNDDDLDKLVLAYPNDPILQQEQHNRLDLLTYWTRPHIKTRSMHSAGGFSLAFSPDGNYLAYIRYNMSHDLILLFVPTGFSIPVPSKLKGVSDFAFSPDTNMLAVVTNGCVKLWDLRTNRVNLLDPLCSKEKIKATSVAFSPDGTLAVGHERGVIRLLDVENHIELQPIERTTENLDVEKLEFSHDSSLLAATFETPYRQLIYEHRGTIIWNIENRNIVANLPLVRNIKFAAKVKILATNDGYDVLELWSFKKGGTPVKLWGNKGNKLFLGNMVLSPDGKVLASLHQDGKIRLWNAQNGGLLTTQNVGTREYNMTFSPNGKTFAIIDVEEGARRFYAEK